MRKWSLPSLVLILLVACTCQVPSFLSDLFSGRGEARGEMIEVGSSAAGTIGQEGHQVWSFSGRAGDQITISMDSSEFDSLLVLFGPDDNYLIMDDDGGSDLNAMIRRFVLPSSGIHNIVATSFSGGIEGDYTLELERTDTGRNPVEIGGGAIAIGEAISAELQSWTGDVRTFSGQAGDRVTISMQSDDFDAVLEVWGPDLTMVAQNDDSGDGSDSLIEGFVLPLSGTYSIVARGYSVGERGSYRLSLE